MKTKHTQTPWTLVPGQLGAWEIIGTAPDGKRVVLCSRHSWSRRADMSDANAELIVRAVNQHAELVSALRAMAQTFLSIDNEENRVRGSWRSRMREDIWTLIEKAEAP